MATVIRAKKDEHPDSIIRRFKKQVLVDEILTEVRKKDYYKKPSVIRKEKNKEWERVRLRAKRIKKRVEGIK